MKTPPAGLRPAQIAVLLTGMGAVFAAQTAWIKPTNFAGADEWLILRLAARRIVDSPYSNRPFLFLWSWPGVVLAPHRFTGFVVLHFAYLLAGAALFFALVRRLAPREPLLAFLAGAFVLVWTPMDFARYTPVQMTQSGFTFSMLLAIVLFVESWVRHRPVLLALGVLVALVSIRSYEAVLPLLCTAPLLLVTAGAQWRDRRLWHWAAAWEAVMGLALLLVLLPAGGEQSYQLAVMGLDPAPLRILDRLARQYLFHLSPLLFSDRSELLTPAVAVAASVFLLAFALAVRELRAAPGEPGRRLMRLAALGLAWAGFGYAPFALSGVVLTPTRTQFLSGPGIAIFLGAAILLAGRPLPKAWRPAATGILALWVVAVGTGRAIAIQTAWDRIGYYPAQRRELVGLTDRAPDLAPHTLVVLLDEAGAWPWTFSFRSAVDYLYRGNAVGFVWGADSLLFPTFFTPEGVRTEPWASIRKPWGCPQTLHRYDQIVVVRAAQAGPVEVLDEWPDVLPALPAGARYMPSSRIVQGPRPAEQRVLDPM